MKFGTVLFDYNIDLKSNTVFLTGEVNEDMYDVALKFVYAMSNSPVKDPPAIILSTYGGDIYYGLAIYDLIKTFMPDTKIVCVGPVMSAGSIILQAAKERCMLPNSYIMVHYGMEINTDQSTKIQHEGLFKKMRDILIASCKVNPKTVKGWFKKESYFDARRAMTVGLVDRVMENVKS